MGFPTSALGSLRPELAEGFEQFDLAADRQGFVGHRVLPPFEVAKASGTFPKITLESLLQNQETKRSPRTGYNRGDWTFTTDTYATEEHGWEEPVDARESTMYAEFFDFEQICAARAYDVVLRSAEKRIADAIFNATTWTGAALTTGITHEWDDATNAVPITDVNAAAKKVWDGTGLWPNALIINRFVFRNLRNCAQIKDAIASAGAGYPTRAQDVTTAQLAAVFDLDHILVSGSAQNTANEAQTRSLSPMWSDEYAMVCRLAVSGDMREPCVGRTFHWGEDGSQIGGAVESYSEAKVRAEVIRVRHEVDEKVLYTGCGHLLSNVTT